ncbi:hypothetical protein MQA28_25660 [Escherichia coli]|nr:hypothetical protein [Escherichia coli]
MQKAAQSLANRNLVHVLTNVNAKRTVNARLVPRSVAVKMPHVTVKHAAKQIKKKQAAVVPNVANNINQRGVTALD